MQLLLGVAVAVAVVQEGFTHTLQKWVTPNLGAVAVAVAVLAQTEGAAVLVERHQPHHQ
jgi:hypothetical protein